MKMRLLCVSTSKNTDAILEKLIDLAEGSITLALHVGDIQSDIKASSMTRMNTRKVRGVHLMNGQQYSAASLALIQQPEFFRNLTEFIDHLYRRDGYYSYKSHNLRTIHDYIDYYHILFDVIAQKIKQHDISHMLFFNVPHLTYDTIIYHAGQAMGIPSVIVSQAPAIFPNKFFSMASPEHYGSFRVGSAESAPPLVIDPAQPQELFYMKNIKQGESKKGHLTWLGVVHILTYVFLKRPWGLLNPVFLWATFRRAARIYRSLPDWRDPFARFFHENELAYFEHIIQYEQESVDYARRYVYFPLHLQPEMTTSALGGVYRDQAYAIETLAALLPEGVFIYVKENPKQGAYMRGPLFFHRLKRIPSVRILPSHANTYDLLKNCEFVATITGTVGWEAIRSGKRVLLFGNGWYKCFPGVMNYREGLTFDEILSAPLDHDCLQQVAGELASRCHDGIIDRHYSEIVSNFDRESNDRQVASTLFLLLRGRLDPVFNNT
jgi:hypothetical protein